MIKIVGNDVVHYDYDSNMNYCQAVIEQKFVELARFDAEELERVNSLAMGALKDEGIAGTLGGGIACWELNNYDIAGCWR